VTALKAYRHDLTAHLADGLDASRPKLGAQINPPAVVVQAGTPYVAAAPGYCNDGVTFEATVIAPAGDPPAVVDALDDLIDLVRATLRDPSSAGHQYGFQEVSGFTTWPSGDEVLPAVTITIYIERQAPSA
jgi:predicted alpha/beta hydrolase family esterase